MRSARVVIFNAFIAVIATCVFAFDEPDGFKELRFGMTEAEARTAIRKIYIDSGRPALQPIEFINRMKFGDVIGDIRIDVWLTFVDRRLATIHFYFDPSRFDDLSEIFRIRYGKPTKSFTTVLQTAMGAKFTSPVYIWTGNNVTISLSKYISIKEGFAEFKDRRVSEQLEKQRRRTIEDAAKGL